MASFSLSIKPRPSINSGDGGIGRIGTLSGTVASVIEARFGAVTHETKTSGSATAPIKIDFTLRMVLYRQAAYTLLEGTPKPQPVSFLKQTRAGIRVKFKEAEKTPQYWWFLL
jgi:hypothetical protein